MNLKFKKEKINKEEICWFLLVEFLLLQETFFVSIGASSLGLREKGQRFGAWSLSTDYKRSLLEEYVANEIPVFYLFSEHQLSLDQKKLKEHQLSYKIIRNSRELSI